MFGRLKSSSGLMTDAERYNQLSYRFARELTLDYSSSFGLGSRFLATSVRRDIYAIYGLVRIADEIVDTYQGSAAAAMLDELEDETYRAMKLAYSANPIVHAFALTAREARTERATIKAFFRSMRMDLSSIHYNARLYLEYIHGSAEAVGLMCLSVFVKGQQTDYNELARGACALGAAYQKINFLRDIKSDYEDRKRFYFPGYNYDSFDDRAKQAVVHDITEDMIVARAAIKDLPVSCRLAVTITYNVYNQLLDVLKQTTVAELQERRVRVPGHIKAWVALKTIIKRDVLES